MICLKEHKHFFPLIFTRVHSEYSDFFLLHLKPYAHTILRLFLYIYDFILEISELFISLSPKYAVVR